MFELLLPTQSFLSARGAISSSESFWLRLVKVRRPGAWGEKDDEAGRWKLFTGLILYAGCKRSAERGCPVHSGIPAPIHGAENIFAVATAVFSLTCEERSELFKSDAFLDFQVSRAANGAHCNSSVVGAIRACRGYRR